MRRAVLSQISLGSSLGASSLSSPLPFSPALFRLLSSAPEAAPAAETSTSGTGSPLPRQEGVIAACILERLPVVVRPPAAYEVEFSRKV
jgi:hypothetical protein